MDRCAVDERVMAIPCIGYLRLAMPEIVHRWAKRATVYPKSFSISLRVNPTVAPAQLTDSCYAELTSTRDRGSIAWCTRVPTNLRPLAPATNGYT